MSIPVSLSPVVPQLCPRSKPLCRCGSGPVNPDDPTYISDQPEAGNVYRYPITLTISGSSPIALSPKVSNDGYWVYSSWARWNWP